MNAHLLPSLVLALVLAASAIAAEPDGPPLLTSDPANRVWKLEGARGDHIVFQRGPGNESVLILNALAFRDRQINADIETDSTHIDIRNTAAAIDLRLAPARRYRLTFDGDANKPQIMLNGRPMLREAEAWAKIVHDADRPTFQVTLHGATEAKITLRSKGRPVNIVEADPAGASPKAAPATDGPPAPRPEQAPADTAAPVAANARAPLDAAALLRYSRAVFTVRVPTGAGGASRTATGFVTDTQGFAITTWSALRGATRADAVFEGASVPLELYAVKPELDLALVRLSPAQLGVIGELSPLAFETEKLRKDQAAWVLTPSGDAPAVKLVAGMLFRDVPRGPAASLAFAEDTRWVAVEGAIDAHTSGSPLISAEGKVIAIAAWHWRGPRERSAVSYALYSGAARELATAIPDEPLTFSGAAKRSAGAAGPALAFPSLDVPANASIADVRTIATTLRGAIVCPMCKGAGVIERDVKVGERVAGNVRADVVDAKPAECPRCKRSGLNDAAAVYRLATSLAATAARTPQPAPADSDTPRDEALSRLAGVLDEMMRINPDGITSGVNSLAAAALTAEDAGVAGSAVSLIGRAHAEPAAGGIDASVRSLSFQTTSDIVLMRGTNLADAPRAAAVWGGGLVAGFVRDDRGRRVPVIQGGFLLNAAQAKP